MTDIFEDYKESFIKENLESKPTIFRGTTYRNPTVAELKEVNDYNLSAQEIINGFTYTIVGRGMRNEKTYNMIISAIENLIKLYPDNMEYKKALDMIN